MIRVTSVLPFDPKCDPETLEAASQRGTAVHKACEIWDRHKFFGEPELDMNTVDPVVLPYLEGWWKFLDETGFVPTHIEYPVTSERYGYVGQPDRFGIFPDKRLSQIEIKTGVKVAPDTWGLQTSAYDHAFCEMEGLKDSPYERKVVQLDKEGKYKVHTYDDPHDLTVFLAFLTIHKWKGK